jgi:hypothetical protein
MARLRKGARGRALRQGCSAKVDSLPHLRTVGPGAIGKLLALVFTVGNSYNYVGGLS